MRATATPTAKRSAKTEQRSLWYVPHARIRTTQAAASAKEIADSIDSGSPSADGPDETSLFLALHTCAYRAERPARGRSISSRERAAWSDRWHQIRDFIVKKNMPLAYSMIGHFRTRDLDREELVSDALLGLSQATERFDPWRGFRFSTYACNAIQRAMVRSSRQASTRRRRFPLQHEMWQEQPERTDWHTELYVERLNRALDYNLGELTDMESKILEKRFPSGSQRRLTLQQIGDLVGLSKERVRQLQERALGKLREVLQADPVLQ